MTLAIYQHAEIYAIAFGFIKATTQVDRFEQYIAEYSRIPVHNVLDVCCGPSVELREFVRRQYAGIGLDASAEMQAYLLKKCDEEGIVIEVVQADMRNFCLLRPVDFAYNMMGSISYVVDTPGLLSHLECMAKALNSGGLYFIENLAIDWANPDFWQPQTWTMERDGISVQTTYQIWLANALQQTVYHRLAYQVNDHGIRRDITDESIVKLFFPQEFKAIVELQGLFDVIGFFERDSTQPITDACADNIVLLRKK